jgi:putative transposase
MDAQHTKHVTYKLAYHFVWCPKDRKKILVGKLAAFVEQEIRRICEENTWTVGVLNVQEDHVHIFLNAPRDDGTGNGKPDWNSFVERNHVG